MVMKEQVNLKNTCKLSNLSNSELLEVNAGGLSEIGNMIWDAVGYTAGVFKICSSYFATHGKDPIGYYYGK
jgi:hypothetical protein